MVADEAFQCEAVRAVVGFVEFVRVGGSELEVRDEVFVDEPLHVCDDLAGGVRCWVEAEEPGKSYIDAFGVEAVVDVEKEDGAGVGGVGG